MNKLKILYCFLLFLFLPSSVQAKNLQHFIEKNWEDNYYEEINIEPGSTTVEVDGEKSSYDKVFNKSKKESKEITKNKKNIKKHLKDYDITENKDGSLTVKNPYQTKRIIIPKKNVDGYNEIDSISDNNISVLQYETEEDTIKAYDEIKEDYPDAHVDEIFNISNLAKGSVSWGTTTMGMDVCKENYHGNQKVTVAVVDTGLDTTSDIFDGKTISSKSYNVISNNNQYQDDLQDEQRGHGTHVAGVIADSTPNNVEIMPVKIFDTSGNTSELILYQGLDYAVKNADIVNLSLGIEGEGADKYTFLNTVLKRAYNNNIPVFVASGNEGIDVHYSYPANQNTVITVGSMNNKYKVPSYSDYGDELDFVAPGQSIKSAYIGKRSQYLSMSGTSMATPHLASAGAYIKMKNPSISFTGLYNELKNHAVDILDSGWDTDSGYGYVDLSNYLPEKVDLSNITFPDKTTTYNGEKQTSKIQGTLPEGCTVSYTSYTNAGTYEVKANIYKDGTLVDTKTATLVIQKATLTNNMFSLNKNSASYTGKAITANPVSLNNLISTSDYSYQINDNVRPGTAMVTITGKNNFTGTITKEFSIVDNSSVVFNDKTTIYNGKEQSINLTGVPSGVSVSYTSAKNVGTHTITATLSDSLGVYKKYTATLTIQQAELQKSNFSIADTSYIYTGKAITPAVSSSLSISDYTVSYQNNINEGTGSVVITGKNNYKGTVTFTFTIKKTTNNNTNNNNTTTNYSQIVFSNKSLTYDGKAHSLYVSGLPSGATVSYKGNGKVNAGTYTITATIKTGSITLVKTATLTINPKILSNIKLQQTSFEYKGKAIYPKIIGKGTYSVKYSNHNQPGTGKVVITGTGNYYGTVSKSFTIIPKIKKISKNKKYIQLKLYKGKAKVYRKINNGSYKFYKVASGTTFKDKNVKKKKTYYYKIIQNGKISKAVKIKF